MKNKNSKSDVKANNFIDTLTSALGNSEGQSVEEVKQELIEDGVNVDQVLKNLKKRVKHHSQAANKKRLDFARSNRLASDIETESTARKLSEWTREKLTNEIEEISNLLGPELSVSYRDLNESKTEDLVTMLLDLELALKRRNRDD